MLKTTPLRNPEEYQYDLNLRDIAESVASRKRDRFLVIGPDSQRTVPGSKSFQVCRACFPTRAKDAGRSKQRSTEAVSRAGSDQRPLRTIQLAGRGRLRQ